MKTSLKEDKEDGMTKRTMVILSIICIFAISGILFFLFRGNDDIRKGVLNKCVSADEYLPVKPPNTTNNVSVTNNLIDQNGTCATQLIPTTNPQLFYVKWDYGTNPFILKKYDVSTQQATTISTSTSMIDHHVIYPGDTKFYYNKKNGTNSTFDLFEYNITTNTETNLSNTPLISDVFICCSNEYAIFTSFDFGNNPQRLQNYCLLKFADNSVTTFLTTSAFAKGFNIYGSKVVWCDDRNGNYDIFMYDKTTNTETTVCNNAADQDEPVISSDYIVWTDHRNDYNNDDPNATPPVLDHDMGDTFGYKISTATTFPIDTSVGKTTLTPSISGSTVAYHITVCGSLSQIATIMIADLSSSTIVPKPISTQISHKSQPWIDGDVVIWQDSRNGLNDYFNIYGYSISNDEEFQLSTDTGRDVAMAFHYPYVIYLHKSINDTSSKQGDIRIVKIQ